MEKARCTYSGIPCGVRADEARRVVRERRGERIRHCIGGSASRNSATTPQQIAADDYKKFYVLDVRDAAQFSKEHIPGAVNIEWRKVFADRAKLPKDKTILAYCNTGSFSAQVAMALRMDGFENVRILHGGFENWKANGGLRAGLNGK